MNNKKKILFTIRQGSIGGGETYLYNLVSRLDRNKFTPVVLSFTDGEMIDKLKSIGIETKIIETLKPFDFQVMLKVFHFIRQNNFDLVHMHGTRAATNCLIPALFSRVKAIYTVHGWSFHTGSSKLVTAARRLSERFINFFSTETICGSNADIEEGRVKCGLERAILINNSIDANNFRPGINNADKNDKPDTETAEIVVASIARVTYQKDPGTFLKAAKIACEKNSRLKYLLVGEGDLKPEMELLRGQLNVPDKVNFLPFSTNVRQLLETIDIFVLPSLWEVVPLGLLEAMSMEKACIATSIPGTMEALSDGINGLLFPPGNSQALADAILRFADDSNLRRQLGKQARETVLSKFHIDELIRKNEEVYQKLLN